MSERLRGRVAEFDEHKGHGWVEAEDGRRLFLHCTSIADGSRTVAVGEEVTFQVAPGHLGRWEARWVARASASG